MEKLKSSHFPRENVKCAAPQENSVAIPRKSQNRVRIWRNNSAPRNTSERTEHLCPCKCMYVTVSVVFFTVAKMRKKLNYLSTKWWVNDGCISIQWNIFHNEKEWKTDRFSKMDEPWKLAKWKSRSQSITYSMLPFIRNDQNRQIHRKRQQISGYQEPTEKGMESNC